MPFDRIAIVGLGLIGGSIGLAIRRRWPGRAVVGIDREAVLEAALERGAVELGADDLALIAGANLVILAAPVRQNIALLTELPAHLARGAVVTDTGSTKSEILRGAATLTGVATFVGGHPLAGAAAAGIAAARPDLFDSSRWLLTTPAPEPALARLEAFVEGLGAAPTRIDAAAHDRLVASISHLPQLAVSALMHVVGEHAGAEGLALAGRGLRDTTRLASSPPAIWRDIIATNAPAVRDALDALIDVLQALRANLDEGRTLERVFASAAAWKAQLDGDGGTSGRN